MKEAKHLNLIIGFAICWQYCYLQTSPPVSCPLTQPWFNWFTGKLSELPGIIPIILRKYTINEITCTNDVLLFIILTQSRYKCVSVAKVLKRKKILKGTLTSSVKPSILSSSRTLNKFLKSLMFELQDFAKSS